MLFTGLQILLQLMLATGFRPIPGHGSVCLEGHLSIKKEYDRSYGVFIGVVTAQRQVPDSGKFLDGTSYSVSVEEVLRGELNKTLEIFSENSSGRFPMEVRSQYLLFVYRDLGRTMVDNCGNSDLLAAAAKTKQAVQEIRRRAGHGG